jgi:hypothetical protein
MSVYVGADVVTSGLVLHLDAANSKSYPGSGTTWTDLSGLGNHGTLVNGPTYSASNGGSIVFDGTNDYVTVPHSTSLNITGNTITIEAIFKTSYDPGIGVYPALLAKRYSYGVNNGAYGLWIDNATGNRKNLFVVCTAGAETSVGGIIRVNDNTFHYVTCVYDGTNLSFYNNGVLSSQTALSGNILTQNQPILIGTGVVGGVINSTYYYRDSMYLYRIYNSALSADEVAQNFEANRGRYGL